jgi:glycosyltransferase involved in cell wall biosynthesis
MTKLSIITVNYNDLKGLKKTIESVHAQSLQKFDHIIIDGGSTDGSEDYIKAQQNTFSYWISESDRGVYHAMNKGIEQGSGEYVLFLNAGDHFLNSDVLENAIKHLKGESIIYFDLQVVEERNIFIKKYPKKLSFSYFVDDTLPHPATFIKKTAFAKAGTYKEDFKIVSDWKFFIDAICKFQLTYKYVPEVLTTFYIGGMSSDPKNWSLKEAEKQGVLNEEYTLFYQDVEETVLMKRVLNSLKKSRIINALVRFKLLNKF